MADPTPGDPPADESQAAAPAPTAVPASRYAVFVALASAGLAADLATKSWAFAQPGVLTGRVFYWVWEGRAGFQTSLNEGALFGLGQGRVGWFAAVSVAAGLAIPLWLFVWGAARDWLLTIALAGVMAGVLGNLYDRLGMPGEVWPPGSVRAGEPVYAVRDWILLQWDDQWRWPNFNLADSFLVVGAGLILLRAALGDDPAEEPAASDDALDDSADER